MNQDTWIDIPPCPDCGHTWRVTLRELETSRTLDRGESRDALYRVRCPNCTRNSIITLHSEEDSHE